MVGPCTDSTCILCSVLVLYYCVGKFLDMCRDVDAIDVPTVSPITRPKLVHLTYPQFWHEYIQTHQYFDFLVLIYTCLSAFILCRDTSRFLKFSHELQFTPGSDLMFFGCPNRHNTWPAGSPQGSRTWWTRPGVTDTAGVVANSDAFAIGPWCRRMIRLLHDYIFVLLYFWSCIYNGSEVVWSTQMMYICIYVFWFLGYTFCIISDVVLFYLFRLM